jgi:hypothetical protein
MLGLLWAQLEHHVANGFGVADASYKSTMDKLLYGIGQGSCSSPIVWALFNQLLLTALGEEFDCISLVSVDGITTDTRPWSLFMDDKTTGATDDNHNLEQITSTIHGLTQEEDSLVARMEVIIQFFLDLLQVTGCDHAPEKCAWYLICHCWNKGVSKLIQIEPQHRSITIISRSSGQVSGIKRKSPTEGHRTLGFFMTGDGTSNEHKRVMKEKWLAYAMVIRNSTLQRGECSMAYGAYYMPSLAYATPATTLSYKECEDVQRAVVTAILPQMGIVRSAARKVVFGSAKYCCLGLDHLAAIQNYSRSQYLIGHIRSKSITSKIIRQQLDYTQLEIDCSAQVLGQDYNQYSQAILCPSWITAIWESLHACNASVAIDSDWIPHPARIGDITTMEELTGYALVNKRDLTDINRCRVYLRFFFLSNIVNIQGGTIEEWAITGERSNSRHSTWHWPVQQKPPRTMWNKWKAALIAVFNDETTLTAPMGYWLHMQNHQ